MAQTPPRVIFTHIPKTAGSTMYSILQELYGKNLFSLYGIANEPTLLTELITASHKNPDAIWGVSAHIPYGIHARLEGGPWQYFTMLRDPMKRVLSLYYYVRRVKDHPHHIDSHTLPLDAYLQKYPHVATIHIRYLLGLDPNSAKPTFSSHTPLPENALEIAKQRLANDYAAFGLTERFDESFLLLRQTFGWRPIGFMSKNVNTTKRDTLSPEALDVLRKACALDIALYDYGKALFEQRLAAYQGDLTADLAQLHLANQRLAQAEALRTLPRRTARAVYRKVKKLTGK